MISARMAMNGVAAAGLAGGAVLFRFSPDEYSFYPRCPFFALTHHYCPGCGATRAVAALLHGNIAAAMHFNAVVTLLVPVALWYFGKMYLTAMHENRVAWPEVPQWMWKAALACVLLFGVARNVTPAIF